MNKAITGLLGNINRLLAQPVSRMRAVRSDDRGQVVLLSGVMVFLVMMLTIMSFDTSVAIYNRIVAQNAVDSAADAAALWQARGCNLLQHLNNLHYNTNSRLYDLESAALFACDAAPLLLGYSWLIGMVPYNIACLTCARAPDIDRGQELFSKACMQTQNVIAKTFPFLVFAYGNASAKGSGADQLFGAIGDYADDFLSQIGISIPGFTDISGAIQGGLDWLPVYAAPLDPNSLSLHMAVKRGGGLPWRYAESKTLVGRLAGRTFCRSFRFNDNKPEKWGWDDSFYYGNPGFMTWVAGKEGRDELIGFGSLRWLNGGRDSEVEMEENSKAMYTGPVSGSGRKLKIPAFVAFASSQVEGDPVIAKGNTDAEGKIIKVYFPPYSDPKPAEDILIYH